jgi:histone demethylase JARID1
LLAFPKPLQAEYAADLPSAVFGSAFPVADGTAGKKDASATHPFNLNNINSCQESLFQILADRSEQISGVSSPWVYMGMLYACFCWHVEDMYMYSVNYMHKGAVKTW